MPTQVFAHDLIGKKDACIINVVNECFYTAYAYAGIQRRKGGSVEFPRSGLRYISPKVGIRVNAIAPGFFLTQQNKTLLLR